MRDLTFEQRKAQAELIGKRVMGTVQGELRIAGPPARAWDGSASRFTDEQYARSCVLDRTACGAMWANKPPKTRCSLPTREPTGELNADAVHAAAARINQVDACPAAISTAKERLRQAYRQLGEDPPDSLARSAAPNRTAEARARLSALGGDRSRNQLERLRNRNRQER